MPFEKDLGYLTQFFNKLEEHAETLPAAAQSALHDFVAEQRTSWQGLRETILSADGADEPPPTGTSQDEVSADAESSEEPVPPNSTTTARSARDEDPARTPAPRQTASAQPAPPPPRNAMGAKLTVGSLIPGMQ